MGDVNYLAVLLAAVAFFAVGAIWYTALFGKAWQRETGISEQTMQGANMPMIFGLCFAAELVVAWLLGHMIARLSPPPHVVMMMAVGLGGAVMTPAIAINYLYQRKSLKLFLIDAGHFIVGTAAMGAVFIALT